MPRVYDSGNDAIDFCQCCFPKTEEYAEREYGDTRKTGEGPDGRGNCFGYDCDHPDYEGEGYKCRICRKTLTERDN